MARTIAQIQQSLIDTKNADATLEGLNSTSNVAIWRLWTWVIATDMWVQESLFDQHKAEVLAIIAAQKPHTPQWYATMAKQFQYGYALPADTDVYPTIDTTSQIVAFAACVEVLPFLRVKVAKLSSGVLAPLVSGELAAFTAYMNRIKDAGVPLNCTSGNPDSLRLGLDISFDPLILDAMGRRLDGTNDTPVQSAVNVFLAGLPFNGVFILDNMIGAIMSVEGVTSTPINYCSAQYGALPYSPITNKYIPDAGFLILDSIYFIANTSYTPDV